MVLDFEPWGINDSYLRLRRAGGACVVGPGGAWNGLVRLNYVIAGNLGGGDPFLVVRGNDVGFDDGRFYRRGRVAPVLLAPAMVMALFDRGLIDGGEATRLGAGLDVDTNGQDGDDSLMLRAALGGAAFTPVYGDREAGTPPPVVGYALRTLADPDVYLLGVRDGLPLLDEAARLALRRDLARR